MDDPLSRIQREIREVTEREREFREGHFRLNRHASEPGIQEKPQNGHHIDTKTANNNNNMHPSPAPLYNNGNGNGNAHSRRFRSQTKGLMQRFIANKGRLPVAPQPALASHNYLPPFPQPIYPIANGIDESPPIIVRSPEGKPIRKGFVPVEEKIQKELLEMKHREHELRRMRRKQKVYEIDLSDGETSSESEDEELPPPGKLKPTKSLGELYEAMSEEVRSASRTSSGQESLGSLKPAKSLAELCVLAPGEAFLAPSSTRLIAQWESLIQQKDAGTV